MPETFDVDHAFEALAQDVMHRAGPPSAVSAIKQARRRRRTALATAAAAALIVVAGVVVPTMVGGDDSSRVAGNDGLRPLPVPAAFAPEGWGPVEGTQPGVLTTSTCVASFSKVSPAPLNPVASGQFQLGRGDDRLLAFFLDYGDDAGSAQVAVSSATDPSNGCGTLTQEVGYAGGEVEHFARTAGTLTTDLWVTRLGNQVGIAIAVSGVAATVAQRTTMSDSLIGALQFPGTWRPSTADPEPSDERFAAIDEAFAGWFPDWQESLPDAEPAVPCFDPTMTARGAPLDHPSREYGSGHVGIYIHSWPSEDEAVNAREMLLSQLAQCNSTPWSVQQSGPTTWIATSPAGTLWMVGSATEIGVVGVREATNPPGEVTDDVVAMLTEELAPGQQVTMTSCKRCAPTPEQR